MKNMMKGIAAGVLAMIVIVAVQMGLTYLFNYQVGDVFSRVATGALIIYFILLVGKKER